MADEIIQETKLSKMVPAGIGRRTLAALLDLVIMVFVGLGIFLGVGEITKAVPGVKAIQHSYYQELSDTGIMQVDAEKGTSDPFVYEDYKEYEQIFYKFYSEYLPSRKSDKYEHTVYWYNVHVYGLDDDLGLYSQEDLNARGELAKNYGKKFFAYFKIGDVAQYDEFALPIVYNNDKDAGETISKEKKKIPCSYYYVSDAEVSSNEVASKVRYVYYYALSEFTSLPKVVKAYNDYHFYTVTLALVIGMALSMIIFYLILPLVFKNGETIAKLSIKLGIVNKLGYQVNKVQVVLRFLIMFVPLVIVLLFLGLSIVTVGILVALILASYLTCIFTKKHVCLHDLASGTVVIDKAQSVWFKDAKDEQKYENEVDQFTREIEAKRDVNE